MTDRDFSPEEKERVRVAGEDSVRNLETRGATAKRMNQMHAEIYALTREGAHTSFTLFFPTIEDEPKVEVSGKKLTPEAARQFAALLIAGAEACERQAERQTAR